MGGKFTAESHNSLMFENPLSGTILKETVQRCRTLTVCWTLQRPRDLVGNCVRRRDILSVRPDLLGDITTVFACHCMGPRMILMFLQTQLRPRGPAKGKELTKLFFSKSCQWQLTLSFFSDKVDYSKCRMVHFPLCVHKTSDKSPQDFPKGTA